MARHRLLIYALSGGIFGIADWYYPTLLRVLVPARSPAWLLSLVIEALLIYGVWLMLALPIAWYETVHTLRPSMAARGHPCLDQRPGQLLSLLCPVTGL